MTAYSTPYTHADTTRLYGVPLWQFDHLLNDAIGRRAADSAYRSLVLALAVAHLRTVYLDSAWSHSTEANKSLLAAQTAMVLAVLEADRLVAVWQKEAVKQKRLKVGAIIIGGIIAVGVLIFGG